MRIALVTSTPVPLVYGGMDRLVEGLLEALNRRHSARLVSIDVDERSEEGILRGYHDFYELDLREYDLAISLKAPAFMIRHPAHVPYLPHRLRVFYDLYEPRGESHANMRRMIHWMDSWGLSRERTPEVFTIGQTVSDRLLRWGGIASQTIHPPTTFQAGAWKAGKHFFAPGRLHPWKRVDLLIRAMKQSNVDAPLIIAGTGPQEEELRALAAGDPRIRFAGRVDEAALRELYSESLAVLFAPINEDLGLITWEAFKTGKPVLTTCDAGEPSRIVEEGKSGWVCEATPEDLARRIDWIAEHGEQIEAMQPACRAAAKKVTWDDVVDALLAAGQRRLDARARPISFSAPRGGNDPGGEKAGRIRLLVTDNQIIDPPVGGGRIRIWELYRHLPDDFVTTYVGTHDHPGPAARDQWLAPNVREVVMPLTAVHFKAHEALRRLTGGDATIDTTIPLLLGRCSPRYLRLIRNFAEHADVLITAHPWMAPFVDGIQGLPRVYDSQNCEAAVKGPLLERTMTGRWIAGRVAGVERMALNRADLTLACSDADADQFAQRYGARRGGIVVVPNGVDCERIRPGAEGDGRLLRDRFSLPAAPIAIFVGSDYEPNLEAVDFIATEVAPAHPGMTFAIVGGASDGWRSRRTKAAPDNVRLIGKVDDAGLLAFYRGADLALNPMRLGSGTNIKMLEYMAAGLPILATAEGARGIGGRAGEHWAQSGRGDFAATLGDLMEAGEKRSQMREKARHLAESSYDWRAIAAAYADALRALLATRSKEPGR